MSSPTMSPEGRAALERTNKLYDRLAGRSGGRKAQVKEAEDYFRGYHPLVYATPEWSADHAARYKDFADNWCGVVGSAPVERTEIQGFRLGEDASAIVSDDEKLLMNDWHLNEMPMQSSQGFLMTTIARRSSVLVWGDSDDNPVATWERPDQVIVDYDPAMPWVGRYALKTWCDDELELATLYTADKVWKWQRPRVAGGIRDGRTESGLYVPGGSTWAGIGGWSPRQDDDKWPIKNPMGELPVNEYPNRPMLGGEPLSDIEGTIAMQNAINLMWAYLFTAADYAAMPARVVLGAQPPKMPVLDDQGKKIAEVPIDLEQLARGRLMWLTGQGKIAQWDAAKLDVFTSVINVAVKHIAAQTRTPIHYIVGELGNVNGETLTATETPLAMKVRETHQFSTSPTRRTFRLFALVRGKKDLADSCRLGQVQWRNPETRSEAQVADAATKDKAVGFAFETILRRRYNMSPTEIELAIKEQAAEQTKAIAAGIANALNLPPAAVPVGEPQLTPPPPVPPNGQ